MPQVVPVYYAPDYDTAWSANPGALASLNAFAPLQQGAYGSIGTANFFGASTITGSDILTAYMFRQVNGGVRLIVGRAGNLDEYDSSANLTNQGTGYTATNWCMAAWGDQIIATDFVDAVQSSTATTFGALAGSPPKAVLIAANQNFVMLANTNTSTDQVAWCALRNPNSWTPSIATQAGNDRLLDSPGPIRALVAYNDSFVAFKDNAMFIGNYIGPPYVWGWQAVSRRLGCVGMKAVRELDGKLYFLHTSGFYEFDGQSIRNVGLPVFQSYISTLGYVSGVLGKGGAGAATTLTGVEAVADDIEGVVWFIAPSAAAITGVSRASAYGYNPRSGKWGVDFRAISLVQGGNCGYVVNAHSADVQAFKADATGRYWMIWNDSSLGSTMRSYRYPIATTDNAVGTFTTGLFGSNDGSQTLSRIHHRTLSGTVDDTGITVTVTGYTSENKNKTNGNKSGVINTEYDVADVRINSRYRDVSYSWTLGKKVILAGLATEFDKGPSVTRR